MSTLLVHDVMSTAPVTVSPATPVSDLLALFDRHDFNAFPVVNDRSQVVGVVSKLDVLSAFLAERMPPYSADGTISEVRTDALMMHDVIAVGAEDSLLPAGELMVGAKLYSLPVVERQGGEPLLVGMVRRGEILRGLRYRLEDAAAGRTPWP
jgi:CBS domain-containing protein